VTPPKPTLRAPTAPLVVCGKTTVCTSTTVLLPLALPSTVLKLIGVKDGVAGTGIVGAAEFVAGVAAVGEDGLDGVPVEVGVTWFGVVVGELDAGPDECVLPLPLAESVTVTVTFVPVVLPDPEEPPVGLAGVAGGTPSQTLETAPLSEPRSPRVQLLLVLAQRKAEVLKPTMWLQRQAWSERSDLHPTFDAAVCVHASAQSGMSFARFWAATWSKGAAARRARTERVVVVFMMYMAYIVE
jgi:hypothetical protein